MTKEIITKKTGCWFNDSVVAKFGPEASCYDPSVGYDNCHGQCQWGPKCPECKQPRIYAIDICCGRNLLCMNPECVVDK